MIVDSSAVLAIFLKEAEGDEFAALIRRAATARMPAVSYLELFLKVDREENAVLSQALDDLVEDLGIRFEPVTFAQAQLARDGFRRYGKGRHPAALNFGDCFVYALAKTTGERLLFKGRDFAQTDIASAR